MMPRGSFLTALVLAAFWHPFVGLIAATPVDGDRRQVAYIMLEGNCPGAFLVDVPLSTLDECKQHCGVLSQCAGFSYSTERDLCFLKKQTCDDPVPGSEYVFYQKFDQTLTDIPKLAAENLIDDPAAMQYKASSHFIHKTLSDSAAIIPGIHNGAHGKGFIPRVQGSWNATQQGNRRQQESGSIIDMLSSSKNSMTLNPVFMRQVAVPSITVPNPDCSQQAGSNSEFVLMFMFNQPDRPQNLDLEIYVSGDPSPGNQQTDIRIVMPRFPSYNGDRGTVSPGQTVLFKLPQTVRMSQTGIDSKVIHVIASNPNAKISVYAVNRETYTADGFLVFPTSQLGLEHYVLTWQPSTRGSEFGLAVPYDGTVIQIILPASPPPGSEPAMITFNGRTYTNGDAIQLSMQANDAFLAINDNLNSDLTGTRIISSKPVAVFSGDKRTAIKYITGNPPTRDHLVEQLPPVQGWGMEFVFCTSPNRTDGDYMKIVASQDATQVLVYGGLSGAQRQTIAGAGNFVLIETAPQECLYISSSKPVMVGKFVVSQKPDQTSERTDPATVIVPPTNTYRSAYAFMTPTYAGLTEGEQYMHFILIGVKKDYRDGFIVDGNPISLQQVVPTYNDYICGYLRVSAGQHSILHSKSDAKFLAILYGAADRESYAFVLGESLPQVCQTKPNCTPGTLFGTCPYCQEAHIAQGCYGSILSMACPVNLVVKVISAYYGWFPGICGGSSCGAIPQGNCGMYNVYDNIARFCNSQSMCNFPVAINALFTSTQFSNYFCPLCSTRVQVYYTCVVASTMSCANLVGRTPLFVRYTASSFWRREPGRSDVTCPDDISMLTPVDAMAIPAYLPEFGRFASPHGLIWCPSECDTNSSYIQIDLGRVLRITGYAIQGRIGYEQWVNSVAVDYSSDGRTWVSLGNSPGSTPQVSTVGGGTALWQGADDAEHVTVCDLSAFAIDARYFRAWIRGYEGYPCMHLDVFACNDVPQQAPIPPGCPPLIIANSDAAGKRGVIGQRVTVNCRDDWMLPDFSVKFTAVCDSTGAWTGATYQCTEVRSCGPIPDVDHARYTVTGDPSRVGASVTYTCDPGYTAVGSQTVTCQPNTLWTAIPHCDQKQ